MTIEQTIPFGTPIFLTLDHILRLHARQIEIFGGSDGMRDIALVESAMAQPRQAVGGQYLHKTLAEMAAAYLYYLAKNHGFVDGNKRVAAAAALTFLEMNGIDTNNIDETEMGDLTIAVASGTADKSNIAVFFGKRTTGGE
ncbi:MAG TPA: type II toxin-antitoxin system death-on-curing family toxin [Tepidisphaeraceae bacterium]|nr:type II toxin-antitoxin system death-on-curing family toxin [Tepidisphaeraceae bacterium]